MLSLGSPLFLKTVGRCIDKDKKDCKQEETRKKKKKKSTIKAVISLSSLQDYVQASLQVAQDIHSMSVNMSNLLAGAHLAGAHLEEP